MNTRTQPATMPGSVCGTMTWVNRPEGTRAAVGRGLEQGPVEFLERDVERMIIEGQLAVHLPTSTAASL